MIRRALVSVVAMLLAGGCSGTCRNEVVSISTAPGGKHQVAMFSRDCGATTGYSTQVSVLDTGEAPTGAGNVLVADGGIVATAWGGPWVEVAWLAPDHLLIRYDSRARIFQKPERVDGVAISYQAVVR